jgi:hypothetical protein
MNATLREILSSPEFAPYIVEERLIPATEGAFAPFPPDLEPRIAAALRGRGITAVYTHQAEVWENVKAGRHTVVVTPTASGKTLCYNLPVLDALDASLENYDTLNQRIMALQTSLAFSLGIAVSPMGVSIAKKIVIECYDGFFVAEKHDKRNIFQGKPRSRAV